MEEGHVMALGQVSLGQSHFHSPLWDLELHCAGDALVVLVAARTMLIPPLVEIYLSQRAQEVHGHDCNVTMFFAICFGMCYL
jgi:hypothetical protein